MSGTPAVSVVMPFLNAERFLEESVCSVIEQTRADWELILVDDGSSDSSAEIATRFAKGDPRITVLPAPAEESLGASAARNRGIQVSRGRYLAFLDADDVWRPGKLAAQLPLLERAPEAVMLYSNTLFWFSWSGEPESEALDHLPDLGVRTGSSIPGRELLALWVRGLAAVPCTCAAFVRREAATAVGGWEEGFRQVYTDQAFFAKVMLTGPVLIADGCWDLYRQHPASSVQVATRSGELTQAHARFLRWLRDHLAQRGEGESALARTVGSELWWLARAPWQRRLRRMLGTKMIRRGRRLLRVLQTRERPTRNPASVVQ